MITLRPNDNSDMSSIRGLVSALGSIPGTPCNSSMILEGSMFGIPNITGSNVPNLPNGSSSRGPGSGMQVSQQFQLPPTPSHERETQNSVIAQQTPPAPQRAGSFLETGSQSGQAQLNCAFSMTGFWCWPTKSEHALPLKLAQILKICATLS